MVDKDLYKDSVSSVWSCKISICIQIHDKNHYGKFPGLSGAFRGFAVKVGCIKEKIFSEKLKDSILVQYLIVQMTF